MKILKTGLPHKLYNTCTDHCPPVQLNLLSMQPVLGVWAAMKLPCSVSGQFLMVMYIYSSLRMLIINFPHFYLCRNGELEIVKYLIEVQGFSAGCTDNSGRTPLHLSCK